MIAVDINIYYEGERDGPVERLCLGEGETHTALVSGKQTIEVVEVNDN